MPREASKCREWEKERRDRFKQCFLELSKQLPCYDPSITLSKVEILQRAKKYISELQLKTKELLTPDESNKAEKKEIKQLYERIKKLLLRNEQLNNLLKDAGIKVPKEIGVVQRFKNPLLWSHKFSPEQAKILGKREAQKENTIKNKLSQQKLSIKSKPKLKSHAAVATKHRKSVLKKNECKKGPRKIKVLPQNTSSSKCLLVLTQPSATKQPCYIITNAPSKTIPSTRNTTVVTNSNLLTTPLVTASIKPPSVALLPKKNTPLSTLGPGTLILANGSVVPVLPPIPNILPTTPAIVPNTQNVLSNQGSILISPSTNNTTLLVVSNKIKENTLTNVTSTNSAKAKQPGTKTLSAIKPKPRVPQNIPPNKVPIPANPFVFESVPNITNKISSSTINGVDKNNMNEKTVDPNVNIENNKQPAKRKLETSKICETKLSKVSKTDKTSQSEEQLKKLPTKMYSIDSLCNENESDSLSENKSAKEVKTDNRYEKNKIINTEADEPLNEGNVQNQSINNKHKDNSCDENITTFDVDDKKDDAENKISLSQNTTEVTVSNAPAESIITNAPSENIISNTPTENIIRNAENKTDKVMENEVSQNKTMDLNLSHSELSNDIFASLQVPTGGQNPESTSPTAAFLLAFPLVSTLTGVKVSEVIEEENSDSQRGTPTLLQIGTMEATKPTQSLSESLTPNLLNLDNFSFFSTKDICSNFYPPFDNLVSTTSAVCTSSTPTLTNTSSKTMSNKESKLLFETSAIAKNISISENTSISNIKNVSLPKSDPSKVVQENIQTTVNVNKYNSATIFSQANYENVNIHRQQQDNANNYVKNKNDIQKVTPPVCQPNYMQCNTFNPFTDVSKQNSICTYSSTPKSCSNPLYTNSNYSYNYGMENSFNQMTYSLKNTTSSSTKNDHRSYYCENPCADFNKVDNRKYSNQAIPQFSENYCNAQMNNKDKFNNALPKVKNHNQPRPPVNWMTTPDIRQQVPTTDYLLPSVDFTSTSIYSTNSFVANNQSTYFNANSSIYPTTEFVNSFSETRKPIDAFMVGGNTTFQKNDIDDNQFSWSPTKLPLLETQNNFVSSTLPTLVGDLALGNTSVSFPEKSESLKNTKENFRNKDGSRKPKIPTAYDNQSNFLSVSQLVDHSKNDGLPARTTSRRNSGNRTNNNKTNMSQKNPKRLHKTPENKESGQNYVQNNNKPMEAALAKNSQQKQHQANYSNCTNQNWLPLDSNKQNRHGLVKHLPSSYSAEALIGHQTQNDNGMLKQKSVQIQNEYTPSSKPLPVSTFLPENIIPYFPPVDLPQDNSFAPQNQNYQNNTFTHNFTSTIQNSTYSSNSFVNGPTITTNYLPTTNFIPEIAHDYNSVITDNLNLFSHASSKTIDKQFSKNLQPKASCHTNRADERKATAQATSSCSVGSNNFVKKSKRKQTNDSSLPGFVDFGFLSMPATINSPILPDDFHSHTNFLPPPAPAQLYPCKNPLYTKQGTDLASSSLIQFPPVTRGNNVQPEISPSINNIGTSLTNFNLSTIFPEINKGSTALPDIYVDSSKNKDFVGHRNYLPSTPQVPFTNKPSFTASYLTSSTNSFSNS